MVQFTHKGLSTTKISAWTDENTLTSYSFGGIQIHLYYMKRHILLYIHTKFHLLDIKNNRDMAIFKRAWRPFWIFFSYSETLGVIQQSLLSILRKKQKNIFAPEQAGSLSFAYWASASARVQQSLHTKFLPLNV